MRLDRYAAALLLPRGHLELWMIDGLRAMLAGRRLVDLDEEFEILRSLPHGHVAAVLGCCATLT